MAQTWKYIAALTGLLASVNHSVWATDQVSAAPDFDDAIEEQHITEVPIESIQQFVQIYGTVKDNYVDEKSDDVLFLQAIKGLVGGLDHYSRYLTPEEYRNNFISIYSFVR